MHVQKLFLVASIFSVAVFTVYLRFSLDLSLIISYFIAVSGVTLLLYLLDKLSAISDGRIVRVPERTLHVLALVGGSLGALIGQQLFRHKTRKTSFLVVYYLIVCIQIFVVWLVYFGDRIRWPFGT